MCSRPISKNGHTFACRTCNECISKRRVNWIARAMAEKASHKHTLCVALTYSDETQQGRDGAAMFAYSDVRDFIKRVASVLRRLDPANRLRFLCAGEQGDRNGRCHWHLILYSNVDLTSLGIVHGFKDYKKQVLTDREDMLTVGKLEKRLNWSLWPLGYSTFQEADHGGMAYVLSYCLKDQFTCEKSQGTMREAKSENFATGLFRMSKRPAIGEDFLMRKLEALEALGAVLPSLKISIPEMNFPFEPRGSYRETLLWGLVALNKRILWATGANAPQWPALLAECKNNLSDMEILNGLPKKTENDPSHEEYRSLEQDILARGRQTSGHQARTDFARTCANALPCGDCLRALDPEALAAIGVKRSLNWEGVWEHEASTGADPVAKRQKTPVGRINSYCLKRGSKIARHTAPKTGL